MKAIRRLAWTFVAALALASGASAQAEESGDQGKPGQKSGTIGALASVIGTVAPMTIGFASMTDRTSVKSPESMVVLGGYVVGPSLGHVYAGQYGAALKGIGFRLLPLGIVTAVSHSDHPSTGGEVLAVGAVTLGVVLAVTDIVRVPKSVRAYNEEHAHPRVSIGVVPGNREVSPAIRVIIPM